MAANEARASRRPVTRAQAAAASAGLSQPDTTPSHSPGSIGNVSVRRRGRRRSPPVPELPTLPSGDFDSDDPGSSDEEETVDNLAKASDAEVAERARELLQPYLPVDVPFADPVLGDEETTTATLQASLKFRVDSLAQAEWTHGPLPRSFAKPDPLYRPHPSVALLDGSLLPPAAYADDAESAFNPAGVTASMAELGLSPSVGSTLDPIAAFAPIAAGPYGSVGLGVASGYLAGALSEAMYGDDDWSHRRGGAPLSPVLSNSFSTSTGAGDHRALLQSVSRLDMA